MESLKKSKKRKLSSTHASSAMNLNPDIPVAISKKVSKKKKQKSSTNTSSLQEPKKKKKKREQELVEDNISTEARGVIAEFKQAKQRQQAEQAVTVEEPTPVVEVDEEEKKKLLTFAELGLCEALCDAVAAVGWKLPSEIQRESLPYTLKSRDVIGLAETGSGKTGAFGLPILQHLLANPQPYFALILAPTRELVFQIGETMTALGAGMGATCVNIIGGVDMIDQQIALAKRPHIIVASPGRIVDHLENTKGFHLRNLKYLVMDEADRLLNLDFEKELDTILQVIPRERNTLLFSATMTSKVSKLQRASLVDPVKIEVAHKYQTAAGLVQQYLFMPAKHKDVYLAYLLNEMAGSTSIIFTSTCEHSRRVALMLRNLGFAAIPLHGKMTQPQRLGSLNKFKAGQRSILIATDVASRGLDIPMVDMVINMDIPTNSKDYIHRVGRTARAGRSGRALTLVTQYDVELFQRIEGLLGHKLDLYPTNQEEVLVLLERVAEAQRLAVMELREADETKASRGKSKKKGRGDAGGRGGHGRGHGGKRR